MKRIKFISSTLFFVNLFLALGLVGAYAAPHVNPQEFWPLAFLGLAFPYLFIANILCVLFWLIRGKKHFILSFIVLILGYKMLPNFIQLNAVNEVKAGQELKILSFNVRVFDLYQWSEDKATRNRIFSFLDQEQPDILCLQEFYHNDSLNKKHPFKTLDTLTQFLKAKNYHVEYTTTLKGTYHWGIITFSRYPIVNKGLVPFEIKDDNTCNYTDIQVDDQNIRIFNAHLASIKLDKYDYKAMQEINKNEYSKNFDKELMLVDKIKYGFERRASQANAIAKSVNESPHPVILCGDFNDTPASYAYHTIKGKMKDSFVGAGSGLGRTYIGEFPSFRIDYILHSNSIQASQFTTHPEILSDHHPISASLFLTP